jgi:TolB-like protein
MALLHALTLEDLERWAEARAIYEEYERTSADGALRDEVTRRLEAVRRAELAADVRAALAQESRLANTEPSPRTVGVFPFAYRGTDPEWEPLERALAELLVTDLAVTGRLTVLERVKVQSLLDEIALGEAGFTEPASAARTGRLLGAGRIVQGSFDVTQQDLAVNAAVVAVGGAANGRVDPVTGRQPVERLLDLEKRIALDLHAEMGIALTPAEQARIDERPTASVQALLAFGRGLAASDAGDLDAARASFAEAARIDPSFQLAQANSQRTERVTRARGAAVDAPARAARLSRVRRQVAAIRRLPPTARQHVLRNVGKKHRAVLAEVLGQDRIGNSILIELIFVPAGAP